MVRKIVDGEPGAQPGKIKIKKADLLIYGLGIILALAFIGVVMIRPRVLAARETKKALPVAVSTPSVKKPETTPATATVPVQQPAIADVAPRLAPAPVATPAAVQSPPAEPVIPKESTKVTIEGLGTYEVDLNAGDTALDVLKNAAAVNGFTVQSTTYSFGVMIDAIAGQSGDATHYWSFYCPGTIDAGSDGSCNVGASLHLVLNNEETIWKYEVATW